MEDAPAASCSPVEVAQLLDRLDDDRMLLAELVDVFRAEYPGNLRAAQEAIDTDNALGLRGTGHTLKGALANLSAVGASALAAELEAIGQSANLAGGQATLDRLTYELGDVMRALDGLCPVAAR
jgi:HPt (histidine-containing phosphotransfer) domain-containing protein